MDALVVALLQIMPLFTAEDNLQKGLAACRRAKAMGADLAVFPEMWSNGYTLPETASAIAQQALPADGPFVSAFGKIAQDLGMAVGITFLEEQKPLPTNSFCLFDRHGAKVLTYRKVHTCDFEVERLLGQGEDFPVADLDTEKGPIRVGAMICYDREFPESARVLMLKGAEVALVPNACPMEINRISQLRARAYENMMGIATVNYPEGQPDCNGHSTAFDGMAYMPGLPGSRDTLLVEADGHEGIYLATFPIAQMREYRSREVHGNAYRRPEKYRLLVSSHVEEPFVRKDARR